MKIAITVVVLAVAYVGLSQYWFGSSHPCGILKARMLTYRIDLERREALALERKHSRQGEASRFEDPEVRRQIEEDWKRINAAPETAAKKLDVEIEQLGLSQCISTLLTWRPPDTQSAD